MPRRRIAANRRLSASEGWAQEPLCDAHAVTVPAHSRERRRGRTRFPPKNSPARKNAASGSDLRAYGFEIVARWALEDVQPELGCDGQQVVEDIGDRKSDVKGKNGKKER